MLLSKMKRCSKTPQASCELLQVMGRMREANILSFCRAGSLCRPYPVAKMPDLRRIDPDKEMTEACVR